MLLHHCPFEAFIANLDKLPLDHNKADRGEGGFGHQAGMGPQSGFFLRTGLVLDHSEQPPEQAAPLSFGPDKGEVDIAVGREAHKADGAIGIASDGNDLPRQARCPLLPAFAPRNPRRALDLGVFARTVADGVEDDVCESGIIGGGCPVKGVGAIHEAALTRPSEP